ncbi:MarR family transcriptional regulator [Streptomyces sp. DSM 40907]|uniref:MarR family transcriptional regulator n=1 Tax=Streptomyces kutzneri TaxID=3051179 RepID=UPI0028D37BF7|nr:MarR family transcriptional regulator [Streptomyces sp. DSM 40907]
MKPIGYWLNRTDQALTASMDALLADFGLTRLGWQVLNVLKDGPRATDTAVLTALAAGADAAALTSAVASVLAGGWATRPQPDHLALTDDGRARLAEVARHVDAFRELSATGITREEYVTAVSVLERMTRNLTEPRGGAAARP